MKIMDRITTFYISLLFIFVVATSCRLQETNVNPNVPSDVPISAILTGGEASLGFALGSDINPITNIFVQQFAGANGDAAAYENYTENAARYDQGWIDLYTHPLKNFSIVKAKGQATNSPYYVGIARILLSFGFGTLTDIFGDIPYHEALKGKELKAPAYDKQEDIYKAIQLELDSAIEELSRPATSFTSPQPGNDDIIYKGATSKWIAAAWTLKARYALHLSKINPLEAASKALEYSQKGIQNNDGDLQLVFGTSSTNSNPYAQIQSFRKGWLGLNASFVNLLNGNSPVDPPTQAPGSLPDPRRSAFATSITDPVTKEVSYKGFRLGTPGNISFIGPYFATATSPVIFASFSENKFIEAEARWLLNSNDPAIADAYQQAIQASFNKVILTAGDTNATPAKREAYISGWALTGDPTSDLDKIITQKYIALFTQSEVWVDYRRTGFPALAPAPGTSQIPRRGLYPQHEQLLNATKIPTQSADHFSPKLWWDQ